MSHEFWIEDDETPAPRPFVEERRDTPTEPLCDLAAERATLGAVTMHAAVLADVLAIVQPGDFHDDRHRVVLDALVAIDGRPDATDRGAVNLVALGRELRRAGRYNTIGGAQYVEELSTCIPTAVMARESARVVADLAARRRVRDSALTTAKHAADAGRPIDATADSAATAILAASKGGVPRTSVVSLGTSLQRLEDRVGTAATRGLALPWPSLDNALRGLRGGRLHLLAAKTSMGKSSLARNLATALAAPSVYYGANDERSRAAPVPVLYFAAEMPTDENTTQVMASLLECAGSDVENGTLTPDRMQAYCDARGALGEAPLFFDDETNQAAQQIALARQFARKHKPRGKDGDAQVVIVVDYLQLCDPAGLVAEKNPTRERMVGAMSFAWKRFAMREDVPVVILSQLNRECGDDECPKLNHLRESGSLEQDSDVVMFLWGKLPDGPALTQDITCTLAKIRGGPRGVAVPMTFQRKATRFYELGTAEADAQHGGRDSVVRDIRPGVRRAANDYDPRFVDGDTGTDDAQ